MNTIGIDLGASATKIIECNKKLEIIKKMITEEKSASKALEIFVLVNNINIDDVEQIILTGVGSSKVKEKTLSGLPVTKVDEFLSGALGGLALSEKTEGLIVSMGTGASFIRVQGNNIRRLIGTGVSAGTITAECATFASAKTFDDIVNMSLQGDLTNVDLRVADVTEEAIESLPGDLTVANLGILSSNTSDEDKVLGFVNRAFETIGVMATLAVQNDSIKNIILLGTLTKIPHSKTVFKRFEELTGLNFIIPQNAEYGVALGAVKNYYDVLKEKNIEKRKLK